MHTQYTSGDFNIYDKSCLFAPVHAYNKNKFSFPHDRPSLSPTAVFAIRSWSRPCEASAGKPNRHGGSGGRHPRMQAWRPPGRFFLI